MKKITFLSLIMLSLSIILFQSCDKDDYTPKGIYDGGVFISNEGTFGQGNGSVSYYNFTGDSVVNNIFEKANNRTLGDVVFSVSLFNEKAYICVNASNKIEVAGQYNFNELGVIDTLPMVRHFIGNDATKGYASVWGDGGQVKVIDLSTNTVTKSIDVGNGPENMLIVSNKLYVANSGGFTEDNSISVISTETDELIKTITLDGDNPVDLLTDKSGNLWVLCMGKTIYDANWVPTGNTPAKLFRINTSTDTPEAYAVLSEDTHPNNIEISPDGNYLYYGGGFGFNGIYKIDLASLTVTANPLIEKYFYGFSIYQNGEIFAAEATSFTDNGILYRYQADGTLIKQYTVGIAPNGASYKRTK